MTVPCFFLQSCYFSRDDVAKHGFAKFFKKNSDEERDHAQILMDYQVTNHTFLQTKMPTYQPYYYRTKGEVVWF